MRFSRFAAAVCMLTFIAFAAQADSLTTLRQFQGYTIVGVFTITGWQASDGKRGDSFEGCDFDRVIFLDGDKALRCASYGYDFGYRPDALILVRNGQLKMLVGFQTFDMSAN